jgi:hypothetical protein
VSLEGPGTAFRFALPGDRKQVDRQIEDINDRCQDMMQRGRTAVEFQRRMQAVGAQFGDLLKGIGELQSHITSIPAKSRFIAVSDAEGLKLPFELLPVSKSKLALQTGVARKISGMKIPNGEGKSLSVLVHSLLRTRQSLRVLLVASDVHGTLTNLTEEMEEVSERIRDGCDSMGLRSECELIKPPDASSAKIASFLESQQPFHLFHYSGHGEHVPTQSDASGIILRGAGRPGERVTTEQLRLLLEGKILWMAYLNCCYGGAASGESGSLSQQYTGTLDAVLSAGISNVVAFRWAISDKSARVLAVDFYSNLFAKKTCLDPTMSMLEARRKVAQTPAMSDAWAASILVDQSA